MAALASRLETLKPSPTLGLTARVRKLRQEGRDIVSFAAGEPDFNTPEEVCEAACRAVHDGITKYTASAGLPELREAIADKLTRENRVPSHPDQVVVSCGAKHSVYNALMATVGPGDEVILIAPYWMTYADQVRLAGAEPVVVRTSFQSGFRPTVDELRAAITPRTRAIIVNSPSNPTGAVFPRQTLKEIAALAIRHDFWVITDEIYERLVYGAEHHSIAALGTEIAARTITIGGCSKTYSMTGWRIGYASAPPEVAKAMSMIQDQVTSNATSFAQIGAIAALRLPSERVEAFRAEFDVRRRQILERLGAIEGLSVAEPEGAFYVLPDMRGFLRGPVGTDVDLANYLLEEAGVATVPGSVFEGPGHIRLSYAASREDIDRGADRMRDALQRLCS